MSSQRCQFIVQSGDENRLDKFLARQLPGQSRSRLQAIIKDGGVTVNETVATKSGLALLTGDKISICIPEVVPGNLEPESIPLDIVFENEHLVIINKPAGMVVHPAPGHASGTLVHAALGNFGDLQGIGGEVRPGIVHRLEKGTAGLISVAKNEKGHGGLQEQFRLRKVKKTYLALVDGKPPTPSGRVEAAIARDAAHRKQMTVVSDGRGRAAITEFHTVKQFNQHTLVEAHPLTGRTHQIRLHMAFLGCPIVGDLVYGRKKPSLDLERHFLHAYQISIILPGESEARTFQAELPADLQTILDQLI